MARFRDQGHGMRPPGLAASAQTTNRLPSSQVRPASTRDFSERAHYLRNVICSCVEHSPALYNSTSCLDFRHHCIIRRHNHNTRDYRPIQGKPYEALHLAHETIRHFSQDRLDMSTTQQTALNKWAELYHDPRGVVRKLGWADGPKGPANSHVLSILSIFNDVFFFGALDQIEFKWADLGHNILGRTTEGKLINLSSTTTGPLHPTSDQTIYHVRMVNRLGTLLHECVHAYLRQYACQRCVMYGENVQNANGHGRAFQRIVTALGNVSEALLGLELPVSDSTDYLANWGWVRYWPSGHDVDEWNWFSHI